MISNKKVNLLFTRNHQPSLGCRSNRSILMQGHGIGVVLQRGAPCRSISLVSYVITHEKCNMTDAITLNQGEGFAYSEEDDRNTTHKPPPSQVSRTSEKLVFSEIVE